MLTISSPNTDRSLLTLAELRSAAGVSDNSQDAALTTLGNYISAMITSACHVAKAGAIPPTLRLETVSESFGLKSNQNFVALARKPVVAVTSVTENDSALTTEDWERDDQMLYRLTGTARSCWGWPCGSLVVVYSAGYAIVPDDLKYAATKFVQAERSQGARDPLLRRVQIEGVSEREWWVDPTKDTVIPAEVMSILIAGGYVTRWGWMR